MAQWLDDTSHWEQQSWSFLLHPSQSLPIPVIAPTPLLPVRRLPCFHIHVVWFCMCVFSHQLSVTEQARFRDEVKISSNLAEWSVNRVSPRPIVVTQKIWNLILWVHAVCPSAPFISLPTLSETLFNSVIVRKAASFVSPAEQQIMN